MLTCDFVGVDQQVSLTCDFDGMAQQVSLVVYSCCPSDALVSAPSPSAPQASSRPSMDTPLSLLMLHITSFRAPLPPLHTHVPAELIARLTTDFNELLTET